MKLKNVVLAAAMSAAGLGGVSTLGATAASAGVTCRNVVFYMNASNTPGAPVDNYLYELGFGLTGFGTESGTTYKYCQGYAYGLQTLQDPSGHYLQPELSGGQWFVDANSTNINSGNPYFYTYSETYGTTIAWAEGPSGNSFNNFIASNEVNGTWYEGVKSGFAYADTLDWMFQ